MAFCGNLHARWIQFCFFISMVVFYSINVKLMKNTELYRTIEALVQAKKQQSSPSKPSLAHDYCKQQIQKKKLISYNPSSKMNQIMKNFHSLDTYVDVEQLFNYINLRIAQKKKQQDIKTHTNIKWRSKQNIVFDDEEIITKVRQKLGPYNHQVYIKQNQQLIPLIESLQELSCIGYFRKQNSPSSSDFNFHLQNQKKKQENNKFTNKQKWNYFQGNNYILEDINEKQRKPPLKHHEINKVILDRPNLKKKQEKMQLIHQVSTYLQIILENQHRKKWDKKVTNNTIHQNNETVVPQQSGQQKKKTRFRVQRRSTRHTLHKSQYDKIMMSTSTSKSNFLNTTCTEKKENISPNPSPKKILVQNSKILSKKGVKQYFTFRNRNIKQNLLKKIEQFVQYVQYQQKQFKKQKNTTINQLNYIQNKQKINYNTICDQSILLEDCVIKQVQSIVHMQK